MTPKLFALSVPLLLAGMPGAAFASDACDNVLEEGEPASPLFGLDYAIVEHVLAEKICGAPRIPITPRFLAYVEKLGCAPATAIHSELEAKLAEYQNADLSSIVAEGDPSASFSPDEALEAGRAMVAELGGCKKILDSHSSDLP